MAEGLKIQIGADVSQAIGGLKQVETAMQKTVSNSKAFEASVGKSGQALGKIVNPSNQATLALTNLGRVAQDAPFGFLGIANNLNPLLESFQRLKATTGTTGGALKALGKELTGAGGIGFALSVASSLAIVFGDRLFGAGKAAKEAKSEADKLRDSINGIFQSSAKEASQAAGFVAILKSETETRQRKLEAIKELQQIQPEVFNNLKLEGDAVIGLDNAYKAYLENLKTVIAAKIKQAQLEQLIEKQLKLQGVTLTSSQKELVEGTKRFREAYANDPRLDPAIASKIKKVYTDQELQSKATADSLANDIDGIIKDLTELSKGIDTKEIKVRPNKVTIDKAKFTDFSQLGFTIIPPDEFKPVATSAATLFSKEFGEYFKKPGVIDFSLIQAVNDDKLNKETKDLAKDLGTNFSQSFRDAINSGISSIGEGIGNVLSGQDFGSSITDAFSGLLSSLGKALIEYGLIKEGLDKILGPGGIAIPGAVAIGLGVLAIAASTALKNIGGARASGGPVAGNTPYLVGERGPELFTPSVSGSIIPNNQIGSFSGRSQMATVRVTGRLRGNDMILQNARTNRMQTRLG